MTNEIKNYLKYANLQIAAETFFVSKGDIPNTSSGVVDDPARLKANLLEGNTRSSKFTDVQAQAFIDEGWVVVEQIGNTTTGFSGTMFRNRQTGELVISFRSTEFADDAARDNQATNTLEIKKHGWAFGQIADMETWFQRLKDEGKLPPDAVYSVTGYSLGGHLATAFNLLRQQDGTAQQITGTYTFNGAGVGKVISGDLSDVITAFQQARTQGSEALFTSALTQSLYGDLRQRLNGQRPTPSGAIVNTRITSARAQAESCRGR